MAVETKNRAELKRKLKDDEVLTVVKVYAPWCGPCQMYGPEFDQLARDDCEWARSFAASVESDVPAALPGNPDVSSVPTTLFYYGRQLLPEYTVGGKNPKAVVAHIQTIFADSDDDEGNASS